LVGFEGNDMKDWTAIRERYLCDSLAVRLGGLAANLSRMRLFAAHDAAEASVNNLLEESKYFIEWTAAEFDINVAAELVRLQLQLALWQLNWTHIWHDEERRKEMAIESAMWSKRVLEMSGLLREQRPPYMANEGKV